MLEPILVDRPVIMPFKCATCGSQNDGPFTLWHVEIPPLGMLFTCSRCARGDAVRRGFLKGEQAEKLRVVQDIADDAERTVAQTNAELAVAQKEAADWKQRWEEDTAEVERLRGRIVQLEKRMRHIAVADLELVTGEPLNAA